MRVVKEKEQNGKEYIKVPITVKIECTRPTRMSVDEFIRESERSGNGENIIDSTSGGVDHQEGEDNIDSSSFDLNDEQRNTTTWERNNTGENSVPTSYSEYGIDENVERQSWSRRRDPFSSSFTRGEYYERVEIPMESHNYAPERER